MSSSSQTPAARQESEERSVNGADENSTDELQTDEEDDEEEPIDHLLEVKLVSEHHVSMTFLYVYPITI